jgi:hypothetical protein
MSPCYREMLLLGNRNPYRVLVCTMALSEIVKPPSKLINKGLVGHHSSRNFIMRVINIPPNWSSSRLGVFQSMKLTSSWWKYGG